jgi:hypothetical protein
MQSRHFFEWAFDGIQTVVGVVSNTILVLLPSESHKTFFFWP